MELRTVDPRILKGNPHNPRKTGAGEYADAQFVANIKAVGILQPPLVRQEDEDLVIVAGNRRVRAAIDAELAEILVLVRGEDDGSDRLRALSENVVRAQMGAVDQWRAIEALSSDNWTDDAISVALAIPVRTIRKLRLLADIHPAMLDYIASGDMPNENELATIAAASAAEQAAVWKKHKPKKGQPNVTWWEVARALQKRRLYARDAKFGADEEQAFGIVWQEDLFEQGDVDVRFTDQVEAFFAAQSEWLEANLPKKGIILPVDDYGHAKLPPKAVQVWSSPKKSDTIGRFVDPRSGSIKEVIFRLPQPEPKKGKQTAASADETDEPQIPAKTRPEITQKGIAMIGDFRTEALAKALSENIVDDTTMLGLLVLAFGADNVDAKASGYSASTRRRIIHDLTQDGHLTQDPELLRGAAREVLILVLSCRPGHTDSGFAARLVGDVIGADAHLPNMAKQEFLGCLSKTRLEKAASLQNVLPRQRAKDTRAALLEQVGTGSLVLPEAHFALSERELDAHRNQVEQEARYRDYDSDDDGSEGDESSDDYSRSLSQDGEGESDENDGAPQEFDDDDAIEADEI